MDKISNKKTDGNFANGVLADAVFRPILFSTPMVQAILEGRKTQTRRVINLKNQSLELLGTIISDQKENGILCFGLDTSIKEKFEQKCQMGDILWVRETFMEYGKAPYLYKTDKYSSRVDPMFKWKPSIFMPKKACRIFLKVTNVRVERLQDISEQDAISEGINPTSGVVSENHAKNCFQSLWQIINGSQSWHDNPWVWVYDFERVERPLGFC